MVMSSFGLDITEAELRRLCDCTIFGADALKVVDAARHLGFNGTAKHTLSFDEMEKLTGRGVYPIVLIDMRPIEGIKGSHALVVLGMSDIAVNVYDPARGERFLQRQTFITAWAMQHNLTIIVDR